MPKRPTPGPKGYAPPERRALSGQPAPPDVPSVEDIEARMALDDLTGALELSRARLEILPGDARAKRYKRRCEETLTEMYSSRIGDLGRRVRVSKQGADLQWLSMDHRAGFLLSRVDGSLTIEELLEICGMPRLDALRTLHELLQQKVVSLSDEP